MYVEDDGIMLAIIIAVLIFLAAAGLSVYGLVCLVTKLRSRGRKKRADIGVEVFDQPVQEDASGKTAPPEYCGGTNAAHAAAKGAEARRPAVKAAPQPHLPLKEDIAMPQANSILVRCLIILGITIGLLLPLGFFRIVVDERADLYRDAITNISKLWGSSQMICGPALVIPYDAWRTVTVQDPEDSKKVTKQDEKYTAYRVILPKSVDFDARLMPQTRYRGIYNYVVYTSPVEVKGVFLLPEKESFGSRVEHIYWDHAFFSIGVTDLKAIKSVSELSWGAGKGDPFSPGTQLSDLLGPGFHSRVRLDAGVAENPFSLSLEINGSGGLFFTPVGETTTINVAGAWPSPSFDGDLLPTSREITDKEFKASWTIPHLSRTYPQAGRVSEYASSGRYEKGSQIRDFSAGVNLYETVPLYRLVTRAVKYGILFIGMTFVALLSFELVSKRRLHLVQYGFVGIAMSLFYLVLLSLAEHIPFWQGFVAASLVSMLMNGLYITAALRSKGAGAIITLLLASLYGVLYALLQMEGYALLVGTALVLVVVGVLMFLTRHLGNESAAVATVIPKGDNVE